MKKAHDFTDGLGVDIVFDCAGVAAGLEAACKAIKIKGTVVNVAIVCPRSHNPQDMLTRFSGRKPFHFNPTT